MVSLLRGKGVRGASEAVESEMDKTRRRIGELVGEVERLGGEVGAAEREANDLRYRAEILKENHDSRLAAVDKLLAERRGQRAEAEEALAFQRRYLDELEAPLLESREAELRAVYEGLLGQENGLIRAELEAVAALMEARARRRVWYRQAVMARAEVNLRRRRLGEKELRGPAELGITARLSPGEALLSGSESRQHFYEAHAARLRAALEASEGEIKKAWRTASNDRTTLQHDVVALNRWEED